MLGFGSARQAVYHGSVAQVTRVPNPMDNAAVPSERTVAWSDQSQLTKLVLEHWVDKPLGDWQTKGKIDVPRALMARFFIAA